MKIVFFGTPPFAAEILDFLIQNNQEVVAVVTRPDKPRGRSQKLLPSAVKSLVQDKWPKLPLFQPEKASTEHFANILKDFDPDLFIVVAYGEIIKKNLLCIPKILPINVHASLLPKYRGAAPIQRALMNGEEKTGITIIEMVLKMDAGDILEKEEIPIETEMNFGELEKKLCRISGPLLLKVIEKLKKGEIQKIPQKESEVTFAQKISVEDRLIDWTENAEKIFNQIRALSPEPGAFCFVTINGQKKRLAIKKVKKISFEKTTPGSTLVYKKNEWMIGCGKGALSLLEVQLEGKKTLTIQQFMSGIPNPPVLCSDK